MTTRGAGEFQQRVRQLMRRGWTRAEAEAHTFKTAPDLWVQDARGRMRPEKPGRPLIGRRKPPKKGTNR